MEFLDAKDPEWGEMWITLSNDPINEGDPICHFLNNWWEYMGSTPDHHHLRHPHHPKTGKVEFIYIERRKAALRWA